MAEQQQALGILETRGLVALVEATDAMLKAANVELAGPMTQVGNALVTAVVVGDVARSRPPRRRRAVRR
jgi:ethanolamine utilization protein EutM